MREPLERKATDLELEVAVLSNVLQEHDDGVDGDRLSMRLCTLLACTDNAALAGALSVAMEIVLDGRARMYAVASERVSQGKLSA